MYGGGSKRKIEGQRGERGERKREGGERWKAATSKEGRRGQSRDQFALVGRGRLGVGGDYL